MRRIEHGRCNHLTISTKDWYADLLLSKNSIIGPEGSRAPSLFFNKSLVCRFSSFEKLPHRPGVSRAPSLFSDKSLVRSFSSFERPHGAIVSSPPTRFGRKPGLRAPISQAACIHRFSAAPPNGYRERRSKRAPIFWSARRRWLYHTVIVVLHSQIG